LDYMYSFDLLCNPKSYRDVYSNRVVECVIRWALGEDESCVAYLSIMLQYDLRELGIET